VSSPWQPIATAPKDGKDRLDLWVRGYHHGTDSHFGYRVTNCSWDNPAVAYGIRERGKGWIHFNERLERFAWVERNDEDSTATVTHWMPVPEPPP
jgi:hypothetical protein